MKNRHILKWVAVLGFCVALGARASSYEQTIRDAGPKFLNFRASAQGMLQGGANYYVAPSLGWYPFYTFQDASAFRAGVWLGGTLLKDSSTSQNSVSLELGAWGALTIAETLDVDLEAGLISFSGDPVAKGVFGATALLPLRALTGEYSPLRFFSTYALWLTSPALTHSLKFGVEIEL